jgi:hypothetical protein
VAWVDSVDKGLVHIHITSKQPAATNQQPAATKLLSGAAESREQRSNIRQQIDESRAKI